ncbi:HNH endonuclease [Anoxybacillus flavithermus]|nr:HNH endonuclease [Anoxybacillus flavithermus]
MFHLKWSISFPKSRGGTDRVDNLCLACHDCNQRKGSKTAEEFGYPHIQKASQRNLKGYKCYQTRQMESV